MKTTILLLILLIPLLSKAQQVLPVASDSVVAGNDIKRVGKITLEGNRITRPHIIFREIILKEGELLPDSILRKRLEQSRLNLLNTSLFNFVNVDSQTDSGGVVNLTFKVIERWYLFPFPIFEIADRNFNSWIEHKDWRRVNYGAFVKWSNLRGRMEVLNLLIRFGYDERYRLIYDIPYINNKQTLGITLLGSINQNHEVSYVTQDNKPVFYRGEHYMLQNYLASIALNYRPNIFNTYSGIVTYNAFDWGTKLPELNPAYAPAATNELRLWKGTLFGKTDHRDSKPYPIKGYYADLELSAQQGVFSNHEKIFDNYLYTNLSKYDRISQRWMWSAGTTVKLSTNSDVPYFLDHGLGYSKDYVRGYEYYVVDGGSYFLFRSNLKYNLVKPQVKDLKITGSEKFDKIHFTVYFNIFADLGEVFSPANPNPTLPMLPNQTQSLNNKLLRGIGMGMDLVTYYDKVLRVEYSVNHFGQGGFFIHFDAPL